MDSIHAQQFNIWAKGISSNDEGLFSELFRNTYGIYLKYACQYLRDRDAACDIVQDVFIRLWQTRSIIDPNKSLKALLYQMIRNSSLNYIRDNIPIVNILEWHKHEQIKDEDETETYNNSDLLEKQLQQAIDLLPERQREAFELSRFEGLTHEEIALVMNVAPRTVNNHIVAAMKFLRKQMVENGKSISNTHEQELEITASYP